MPGISVVKAGQHVLKRAAAAGGTITGSGGSSVAKATDVPKMMGHAGSDYYGSSGSIKVVNAGEFSKYKNSLDFYKLDGAPKMPLRPPRAVTKEEAPYILPARESTKTTMMPWRGWFQRFLKDYVLTEAQFKKFRETFFFMPDDDYDLWQAPMADKRIPISRTDPTITHAYRTPSPGSQTPADLPLLEEGEDPFDVGYFKRDTRRRYLSSELGNPNVERMKLELMDQNDPAVQEEIKKLEKGPESSPGNNGRFATGPTDFDPTGLRATMSVTWAATEKSLDAHMPDHLPTPVWVGHEQEIIAWYEERDLPVPVGAYYKPLTVSRQGRIARW
jgi:hypothetical protein